MVGATEKIMNALHGKGADFILRIKKYCPTLYEELMEMFEGLLEEQKKDKKAFQDTYGDHYSKAKTMKKNREETRKTTSGLG